MVDEVEIKNVGGKFGVASEATLQLLLNSMSSSNPTRRRMEQIAERSQRSLSRSTDTVSAKQGIFSKTIGAATDTVKFFAKEMTDTTTRLSNLVETVIGNSNLLTRGINTVVGAIDDSVDRFRELSSVGASFNNSIFDMIGAAQSSYLSLDEFGRLVMNNSSSLRTLGGTVTQGAKRFGELSKQLRTSDFGKNLFAMGYGFGDVNDLLMNYVDLVSRDMGNRTRSNSEILAGTVAYTNELEKLTKLTGMSRKEAQAAIDQQMNDQRARMAIVGMDDEQRARYQANLAMASSASQALGDVFLDLADGIPNNPTTQRLTAIAPDIVRIARDFKNMDPGEANNALAELSGFLDDYAQSMGHDSIQALMAADSEFASIFGDIVPAISTFKKLTDEEKRRLKEEVDARNDLTATFAGFENAWNNLVKSLTSGILASDGFMGALSDLSTTVLGLTDENTDGSISWLMTEIRGFVDSFFGDNGSLTNAIREFNTWLGSPDGRESITNFFKVIKDTTNSIIDFFLGKEVDLSSGETDRVGGLFEKIYSEFEAVFNGEKTVLDVIYEGFKNTFTWLVQALSNTIGPMLKDFFYGKLDRGGYGEGQVDPRLASAAGLREGGFLKTLSDSLSTVFGVVSDQFINFWEGPNGQELKSTILGFFEDLMHLMEETFVNSWLARTVLGINRNEVAASQLDDRGPTTPGAAENFGKAFRDQILNATGGQSSSIPSDQWQKLVDAMDPKVYEAFMRQMESNRSFLDNFRWQRLEAGVEISDLADMAAAGTATQEQLDLLREIYRAGHEAGLFGEISHNKDGTSGFENFGSESLSKLHGVEAVIPRNTPAGDFLDRYFTDDWQVKNQAVQPTTDNRNNTGQENLVKYLIQLNNTMVAVLSEIRKNNDLEKQTLNSMRGMGGDLFRSV
jgi:hypothetical protein